MKIEEHLQISNKIKSVTASTTEKTRRLLFFSENANCKLIDFLLF